MRYPRTTSSTGSICSSRATVTLASGTSITWLGTMSALVPGLQEAVAQLRFELLVAQHPYVLPFGVGHLAALSRDGRLLGSAAVCLACVHKMHQIQTIVK